jgi:hypothetical protein
MAGNWLKVQAKPCPFSASTGGGACTFRLQSSIAFLNFSEITLVLKMLPIRVVLELLSMENSGCWTNNNWKWFLLSIRINRRHSWVLVRQLLSQLFMTIRSHTKSVLDDSHISWPMIKNSHVFNVIVVCSRDLNKINPIVYSTSQLVMNYDSIITIPK